MKSAQIIESSGKCVEQANGGGLFTCTFEHEVKATKAEFEWTGPKITPEAWNEVLAFFKWTQDSENSEAMVDMFVHPVHGWKFWAFSQQGGTGMTIKAVERESDKAQRAAIGEGYLHHGTVHHHCKCAAFQSGTDSFDEKNLDGLHLTVGNLDLPQWSLHARYYRRKHKFEPNLAAFWDIGDAMRDKIEFVEKLGYGTSELADKVARMQMTMPPAAETPFFDSWKDNYLVERPVVSTVGVVGQSFYGNGHSEVDRMWFRQSSESGNGKKTKYPHQGKAKMTPAEVMEELELVCRYTNISNDDLLQAIMELGDSNDTELYQQIMEECFKNDVKLEQLFDAAHADILRALHQEEIDDAKEEKTEPTTIAEAYGMMD